jgi:hypothetical protein
VAPDPARAAPAGRGIASIRYVETSALLAALLAQDSDARKELGYAIA